MLSKKERKVMTFIFEEIKGKSSLLVSPHDTLNVLDLNGVTLSEFDKIVNALKMDGYLDLVYSDRRGEKIYCVSLTEKGKGYKRSVKVLKRTVLFRVGLSAALAVFSFLIGLVLKAIF